MKKPHTRIRKAVKRTIKDTGDGTTREEILWLPNQKFAPVQTTDGRRNLPKTEPVPVENYRVDAGITPGPILGYKEWEANRFKAAPVHVEDYHVPAGVEVGAMSEVQKECLRLQETLEGLTNLADSLESNLGPVLRGIPLPSTPASPDKEESPISPVGAQLRSFDTQARKLQETLSFILDRLAV